MISARYQVALGHARTEVSAPNPAQAIALARAAFCAEYPRLWDMIHAAEASRFEVKLVGENPHKGVELGR